MTLSQSTKGMILLISISLILGAWVQRDREAYATINIQEMGAAALESLKEAPSLKWWVELDDQLLVRGSVDELLDLRQNLELSLLEVKVDDSALMFVSGGHSQDAADHFGFVLAHGGRFAVVMAERDLDGDQSLKQQLSQDTEVHGCQAKLTPFQANTVLAGQIANRQIKARKRNAAVDSLVAEIKPERWFNDMAHIATYDRHTGRESLDEAVQWMKREFDKLPNMETSLQSFVMPGGETQYNVVGVVEGQERPEEIVIVGAHYDAIASFDRGEIAPGAEDNASGSAAVLEMARIFTEHPPKATIIFVCFTGEELGLWGSRFHAQDLVNTGVSGNVIVMLNMDMIAYDGDEDYDVLLETSFEHDHLLDVFVNAAATYTNLRVVTSLNPFGSDHVSYLNAGMPSLLVIENDWDSYPGYHRSTDIIDHLGLIQGGETLKMNVAAIAEFAGIANESNIPVIFTVY